MAARRFGERMEQPCSRLVEPEIFDQLWWANTGSSWARSSAVSVSRYRGSQRYHKPIFAGIERIKEVGSRAGARVNNRPHALSGVHDGLVEGPGSVAQDTIQVGVLEHLLAFNPDPHGHGALRPTFCELAWVTFLGPEVMSALGCGFARA